MGLFISFEGVDGCGKTTQAIRLAERLRQQGWAVVQTREPGGTPLGERVRQLLLGVQDAPPTARAEVLLFAADRAQHVDTVIRPALAAGAMVLCDRFADSTRAYQGYGRQLDLGLIEDGIRLATQGLEPHITFLLDLPIEAMASRLAHRGAASNRFELEGWDFYARVRQGFMALARMHTARICVLDALQSPDVIHAAAWQRLLPQLSPPPQSQIAPVS
ncbi:MAG: dTMP kinase [Chloracidobacterium sp.]